eukprot:2293412-Rhodomonas_salina.2
MRFGVRRAYSRPVSVSYSFQSLGNGALTAASAIHSKCSSSSDIPRYRAYSFTSSSSSPGSKCTTSELGTSRPLSLMLFFVTAASCCGACDACALSHSRQARGKRMRTIDHTQWTALHSEIKHQKSQFQYQECGFLYLIMGAYCDAGERAQERGKCDGERQM